MSLSRSIAPLLAALALPAFSEPQSVSEGHGADRRDDPVLMVGHALRSPETHPKEAPAK